MDQRRETRLQTDTPITVTVLGLWGGPTMPGNVVDMSGSGLRVRVPLPLPCGAPVKVETSEILMLGEVSRCEDSGDQFEAGLMLSHVMAELAELRRLNQALLGDEPATTLEATQTEAPTRS